MCFVCRIPGRLNDRRTPLGELNWIFTAVTDTIAWNMLPRGIRHESILKSINEKRWHNNSKYKKPYSYIGSTLQAMFALRAS